jgi:transcriptional regulator with XRE-family HTH domain
MNIERKERLARHTDMSRDAMALRLRAARKAVGLGQEELARDMGEGMTKQKLRNAEKADNDPPKSLMRYFYRAHRIDFNFLIHGDFAQLPADVQARLFDALEALANEAGRAEDLDQGQSGRQISQAEDSSSSS